MTSEDENLLAILGPTNTGKTYTAFEKLFSQENKKIELKCRIDTNKELEYYKAGGILNYVLNEIISQAA